MPKSIRLGPFFSIIFATSLHHFVSEKLEVRSFDFLISSRKFNRDTEYLLTTTSPPPRRAHIQNHNPRFISISQDVDRFESFSYLFHHFRYRSFRFRHDFPNAIMSLKQFTVAAVLAFASVASAGLQPPPQDPARGSDKVRGCYASKGELTLLTLEDANSRGVCNEACRAKNKNVAATSLDDCFCGDKYPPKSTKVDDDKCGEPCPGYGLEACGGLDTFSVYNTGVRVSVGESEDTSSSSSSARPSTTSAAPPGTSCEYMMHDAALNPNYSDTNMTKSDNTYRRSCRHTIRRR